jgi:hypothetical protein
MKTFVLVTGSHVIELSLEVAEVDSGHCVNSRCARPDCHRPHLESSSP